MHIKEAVRLRKMLWSQRIEGYIVPLMLSATGTAVRHADQIFVIDKGQIVQQGKHIKLVKEEGIYRNFVSERKQAVSWKLVSQR